MEENWHQADWDACLGAGSDAALDPAALSENTLDKDRYRQSAARKRQEEWMREMAIGRARRLLRTGNRLLFSAIEGDKADMHVKAFLANDDFRFFSGLAGVGHFAEAVANRAARREVFEQVIETEGEIPAAFAGFQQQVVGDKTAFVFSSYGTNRALRH